MLLRILNFLVFDIGRKSLLLLQFLLKANYAVRKLLIYKLSALHVSSHSLLQLIKCHHRRVCVLVNLHASVSNFLVLVLNVHHLVCGFKLLANLQLQMLHNVLGHHLALKFRNLATLLLHQLDKLTVLVVLLRVARLVLIRTGTTLLALAAPGLLTG